MSCPHIGEFGIFQCGCAIRLAAGTVHGMVQTLKFCVGMVGVVHGMLVQVAAIRACLRKFRAKKNLVKMSKLNLAFYQNKQNQYFWGNCKK